MTRSTVADAGVVVIGAGLSGLVTARELMRRGVENVLVLEAQHQVGGRIGVFVRPNGMPLDTGGGSTGASQPQMLQLAKELGVETEALPAFVDPANMGKFVRVFEGERFVEAVPLDSDPEAAAAHAAALAAFAELAARIPADAPWSAPHAKELDHQSIGQWIDENVGPSAARHAMREEFAAFGDVAEVSLLHGLWFLSRFGAWDAAHDLVLRFVGGTAEVIRKLELELTERIVLGSPVRCVEHDADRVVVRHDGGSIRASAVVLAMEPSQAGKIEFRPGLPAARDRLQQRWAGSHGAKFYAIYDKPFWRDHGLAGFATGPKPFSLALDQSPSDASEGILMALHFASDESVGRYSDLMGDPAACRAQVLDTLALYFGEEAHDPKEYYGFSWAGNRWSDGCGVQLPLGVVSSLLPALRAPVGRIVWAGAEAGDAEWMEGAVTAAQRAAREAAQLLS